jgi:hypothetical protein
MRRTALGRGNATSSLRHVEPLGTAASSSQSMVRCDLATDWAFADPSAPLYAHMSTMPKLPVGELRPCLDLYLHSIKPFLTDAEFEVSKSKVEKFGAKGGLGEQVRVATLRFGRAQYVDPQSAEPTKAAL